MATGLVRSAIVAVMEKSPTQSTRNAKLRGWGQEIIDKIQGEEEMIAFDKFSVELLRYLQEKVKFVSCECKSNNLKREKLWSTFHELRMKGILPSLWKELVGSLKMNIDDPLLEQSLYQEVFEMCVHEYFTSSSSSNNDSAQSCEATSILTEDELNVLRYACGYVARALLKRYEQRSGEVNSQYVACLSEMAVDGEGDDVLSYTKTWFEKINRGGLYPLNEKAFIFFTEIEKQVRVHLPQHVIKSTSDQDMFKRTVHDQILSNDDVQFYWTLLSQDIGLP